MTSKGGENATSPETPSPLEGGRNADTAAPEGLSARVVDVLGAPLFGGHVLREDGTTIPIGDVLTMPQTSTIAWTTGPRHLIVPGIGEFTADGDSWAPLPDALLLGSAKADALRRALNELDTYAAGGPADLTKELRALLGLPRKT